MDIVFPGLVHDGPGAEEGADLHHRVEHHVAEPPEEPRRGHERRPEQDVGQVAHRGIGKPPLYVGLLYRHATAEDNGEHGKPHDRLLRPGPGKDSRPETVVGEADYGKGSCLYHSHRVEQRRHGRGRHPGVRKPGVEGEHGRLDAEPQEGCHVDQEQEVPSHSRRLPSQDAARGEACVLPEAQEEGHCHEAQGRPSHGEIDVFPGRQHCRPCEGVDDQRDGDQGQQLVEEIHGQQVPRACNPEGDPVGHDVEHEEGALPLLG